MRKVIDFHGHLGDIYHTRQNIIWKKGIKRDGFPNPLFQMEDADFNIPLFQVMDSEQVVRDFFGALKHLAQQANIENLSSDLDADGVGGIVMLPIQPNTTFDEYLAASYFEPRILPFTSANFSLPIPEMQAQLERDIARGAKGMKVHPVLQNVGFDDPRLHAAVQVLGQRKIPVLFHVGENDYYVPECKFPRTPAHSEVHNFVEFARQYPDFVLVAGHAGGVSGGEAEILRDHWSSFGEHVYVDTSFRSPEYIRNLVDWFGEDKVLFGTDWPFATFKGHIRQVENAYPNNPEIREKIFYKNAARILKIHM